jgi:hypothetical protein
MLIKAARKTLLGENPSQALMDKYSMQLQVGSTTPPSFIVGCDER